MSTTKHDFGMVGLGVMGRNLLLNILDSGFSVAGLDRNADQAKALEEEAGDYPAFGTTDAKEFVSSLKTPRKIMLLVPAGKVVDSVIEDLLPLLSDGDLLIDGGNSFFEDTDRRFEYLKDKGVHFLGVGVSGGAKGARRGPSMMPGGSEDAYELVRPIFEKVAAKVGNDSCVAFMGRGSAGHYVKMVHNGIEYGLMQLIAEAYDLLCRIGGLSNAEMHEAFDRWNKGRLDSYLIEITADIFTQADEMGEGDLLDQILDKAKQKGTGKWTSQNAMDLGIPVPTIDAAVTMRGLSALKQERMDAEPLLASTQNGQAKVDKEAFVEQVGDALYFSFIVTYAQGMRLLGEASREYNFGLNLERIARIWRGGCIIRAALLEKIRIAYSEDSHLSNLIVSDVFKKDLQASHDNTRKAISTAIRQGVPTLALGSALAYFDAYRSSRLPLNLTQAQRDYFGSHTYERLDREGSFHTEWEDS